MKLEARSIPVTMADVQRQVWTPYRIGERKGHQVHLSLFGTFPVEDFTQKQFSMDLPFGGGTVEIVQKELGQYDVGGAGSLKIFDNACMFTTAGKNYVFTAPIPSRDRTDAICTGMVILGVLMKSA
jgi:hypothetical protein